MTERQKLKALFVCNMNQMRSPTAEMIFKDHARLETRSAGVYPDAAVTVERDLMAWADVVFVMEERQQEIIQERFWDICQQKTIVCLDIPDIYDFMDPILVMILNHRVKEHLVKMGLPSS